MNQTPASKARQALADLTPAVEQMATQHLSLVEQEKALGDRVTDLTRLLRETEQRAADAEARSEQLARKANRADKIDEALQSLLVALDRLPVTMTGASLVPGAVRPAIELYGTYEWKAVTEAKFWVQEALKETRSVG